MPGQAQPSTQIPANVATTTDLENLRKELTSIMRSEIAAAKHDILDGIFSFRSIFVCDFMC